VSGLQTLAKPRRIKASHRRRRKVASGPIVQRYYDPQIGRFLSVDPVTADSAGGTNFNRYWYGNNNPYKFTDPDGRQSVGEMINSGASGCGAVSCAGWAVLSAAWTMTGAESLSQVSDKGWSNVSTGDKIGAVAAVAAVIPLGRIAGKLAEGAVGAEAAASAAKGSHTVYQGIDKAGDVRYVGITSRDVATREAEHVASGGEKAGLVYKAAQGGQGLTKQGARVMEQTLINQHGMEKNGGALLNKINSISPKYWKENGITP
jgi:RHS repeat-associated protein